MRVAACERAMRCTDVAELKGKLVALPSTEAAGPCHGPPTFHPYFEHSRPLRTIPRGGALTNTAS